LADWRLAKLGLGFLVVVFTIGFDAVLCRAAAPESCHGLPA
jgi:hypothetical protein